MSTIDHFDSDAQLEAAAVTARNMSTKGHDTDQNQMSFCRAPEASGIISIKPTDRRTITGSTPGDFRAQAAPAVLPANPGPREAVGQFPLSGKQAASSKPASFPSDQGAVNS